MAKLRGARVEDIPELVKHGEEFYKMTRHVNEGIPYNPEAVANLCHLLVTTPAGFILVLTVDDNIVGFILIAYGPFPFSPDILTAMELAYYIDPKYRKGKYAKFLLEHAEAIAKMQGAKYLTMISMESCHPRHAESVYESMGYSRTETSYTKEL